MVNKIRMEAKSIILYNPNKMNINLTKNKKSQHYIKYINIQYYYIQELINKKDFTIIK